MDKSITKYAKSLFDSIKHVDEKNGMEYWLARELAAVLEYSWRGFQSVVSRAELSIAQTGQPVENHFAHVFKMVSVGYGNERPIDDVKLTRYACYIIAQNGNAAKKPQVAAAQAYFAIQTRKQEIIEQREHDVERLVARQKYTESDKRISEAVLEKNISPSGLGRIKSSGDKKLYGGKSTQEMKEQYGITNPKTPLANRAPNVVLAAKSLANEMTASNLASYPIDSFAEIKDENDGNNSEVRNALVDRGIVPEELPPEEDTDKIMNRFQLEGKKKALEEEQDQKDQELDAEPTPA